MAEPARPEVRDDYLAQLEDHLNCRRYDKAQRMVRSSAIVKMASEEVARRAKMQKCDKPEKPAKRVRFADGSTPADRVHKHRLNDLEQALWSAKKRGYLTTQGTPAAAPPPPPPPSARPSAHQSLAGVAYQPFRLGH